MISKHYSFVVDFRRILSLSLVMLTSQVNYVIMILNVYVSLSGSIKNETLSQHTENDFFTIS